MYPALPVRAVRLIPLCTSGDRDGSAKGVRATAALTRASSSSPGGQGEGVSKQAL